MKTVEVETAQPPQERTDRSRGVRLSLPRGRYSRLLFELALLLPAWLAYQLVRGAVDGRVDIAFSNASRLISLERSLGIFWEVDLQRLIIGNALLIDLFNWVYIWGHLPVVVALAIWIFVYRQDAFARYRNAFLISGAIGLVFFIAMPVAPPRFLPSAGFVDTILLSDKVYHALQHPALVNQYAAMPSLHLGWNLLVGIAVFQTTRWWLARSFAVLMPLMMLAGIVFTGNHYILDAAAGGTIALFSLWIAGQIHERSRGSPVHAILT